MEFINTTANQTITVQIKQEQGGRVIDQTIVLPGQSKSLEPSMPAPKYDVWAVAEPVASGNGEDASASNTLTYSLKSITHNGQPYEVLECAVS